MNMQFKDILVLEDRTYLIGELARHFDVSLRTIRFYEEKGLLSPARKGTHKRLFSTEDVRRLDFIINCRNIGLTVEAIAELLQARDTMPNDQFQAELARQLRQRLTDLDLEINTLEEQRKEIEDRITDSDQRAKKF